MLLLQLFFVFAVAIACPPGPRGPPGSGGPGPTHPDISGTGSVGTPSLLWGSMYTVNFNANETIQCQTLNATGDVISDSLTTGIISGSLLSISGQSFLDNDQITTTGQGGMSLNTMFLSGEGAARGPTLEVDGTTTLDNSQITTSGQGDVFLNTITIQGSTGPGGGVSLSVTGQTKLDGGLITTNTNGQIHSVDLSVDDTAYLATVVITGGNPQPGYVLTSVDMSGATTWAPSGSGGGGSGSGVNVPRVDLGLSLGNATHRFNNTYTKQLFATTLDIKGDVSIDGILTVNGPTTLDDSGVNSITTDGQGNIDIGGTTTLFGITQFDWASSTATSQTDGNGGFMIGGQLQVAGRSTLSNTSVNHLHAAAFEMPTGAFTNAVLVSSTDSGDAEWTSLSPFWSDFSPSKPFAYNLGSRQDPWGSIYGRDIHANNTIYAYNGYTSGFHYAMKAYGPIWTDNGAFTTDGAGDVKLASLQITGGSPQSGYVLTATDTSGHAQWQAPTVAKSSGCNVTSITSGACSGGQKITCVDGNGKVTTGNVCPPAPAKANANASHWTISIPVAFTSLIIPNYHIYFNKVGNLVTINLPAFVSGCTGSISGEIIGTFPNLPSAFTANSVFDDYSYDLSSGPRVAHGLPITTAVPCKDSADFLICQSRFFPVGDVSATNYISFMRPDELSFQCPVQMSENMISYYTT